MKFFKRILISRTDNIGDVILTLPLAGILKEHFPNSEIFFLGKNYTKEIIKVSKHIDHFLDFDELVTKSQPEQINFLRKLNLDLFIHVFPNRKLASLAKMAKIPYRLGTRNRWFHLLTCNILPHLSRKKSSLHEAELNIKLVETLTGPLSTPPHQLWKRYGFKKPLINPKIQSILKENKFNLILHPLSLGSAREWGQQNFSHLIELLLKNPRYNVILTGTQREGEILKNKLLIPYQGQIINTTGHLTLAELVALIAHSQGIVAASTGPLHIGAMSGIHSLGLYIMTPPMHPGRWKPIGEKASFLVNDKNDLSLDSIEKISAKRVFAEIEKWY
jgi:ADP-heptose:LPS heptosyltransferase